MPASVRLRGLGAFDHGLMRACGAPVPPTYWTFLSFDGEDGVTGTDDDILPWPYHGRTLTRGELTALADGARRAGGCVDLPGPHHTARACVESDLLAFAFEGFGQHMICDLERLECAVGAFGGRGRQVMDALARECPPSDSGRVSARREEPRGTPDSDAGP